MDEDLRDLLKLLNDHPSALPAEDQIRLGDLMYEMYGSVEKVKDAIEAATGEEHVIIRLDLLAA